MSSEREQLRLHDILDNIDRISGYVSGMTFEAFENDIKTIDATERCLQRITEAVIKIGPERMSQIAPELSVEDVRGLGNRLRHEYDKIDLLVVFNTIRLEFPDLRAACASALDL